MSLKKALKLMSCISFTHILLLGLGILQIFMVILTEKTERKKEAKSLPMMKIPCLVAIYPNRFGVLFSLEDGSIHQSPILSLLHVVSSVEGEKHCAIY